VVSLNGLAIGRLEGEMEIGRRRAVVRDEELVRREPAVAFTRQLEAERRKCSRVEALAYLEICDAQVDVVDKPASVRLRHGPTVRTRR